MHFSMRKGLDRFKIPVGLRYSTCTTTVLHDMKNAVYSYPGTDTTRVHVPGYVQLQHSTVERRTSNIPFFVLTGVHTFM